MFQGKEMNNEEQSVPVKLITYTVVDRRCTLSHGQLNYIRPDSLPFFPKIEGHSN